MNFCWLKDTYLNLKEASFYKTLYSPLFMGKIFSVGLVVIGQRVMALN